MYSFHSSLEEKNQLLHTLTTYGIETTVDRSKKKDRIREWIQASAIAEENEGDEDSDAYEDSEFYEDEDRENESEDAERVPMRGRHFPERRPSDLGKGRRRASRGRSSASIKPVERKIPFAPQVAEERETIARFASFPNGDPSLAAVGNGRDLCATLASAIPDASTVNPATSILQSPNVSNGRGFKDPAKANGQESLPVAAGAIFPTKPSVSQTSSAIPEATSSPGGSRVAPMSPQIPARKNRAHTAPFPDARIPEGRTESARRAQSATALRTPEVDEPPRVSVVASPRPLRADNPAVMSSSSRAVVARSARAAPPTTSDEPTSPPRLPNNAPPSRAEDSAASSRATPENVSATCLVMQSFSAFQDLAANGGGAPLSRPAQRPDGPTLTYGKDAYEHYGIAQGAILPMRVKVVRQDSAGSGSRSASN